MATTIAAPARRVTAASKVFVLSGAIARPEQHWGERAVALVLACMAMVLNATLVGAVIGIPLFLLALSLMMASLEQ